MPQQRVQRETGVLRRVINGLALVLATGLCGFALTAWLAGRAGVADGQGLAAGAMVVGYGLLGAFGGALLAIVAMRLLPRRALRGLSWLVLPLGAVILVSLVIALGRARSEMAVHLAQAYDRLPAFRLELLPAPRSAVYDRERFVADWGAREYAVADADRVCEGPLSGGEAVALLTALRAAEGVLFREPAPCDGLEGPVLQRLRFHIPEGLPPDTSGDVPLTAACLARHPDLGAPGRAAATLIGERGVPPDCRPVAQAPGG